MAEIDDQVKAQIPASEAQRDALYYCQNVILRVESKLYCVPKICLTKHSELFETMFTMGSNEGQSDDCPIVLEGYKSRDFECLLKVVLPIFPQYLANEPPALSREEWFLVLRLSTVWNMVRVRLKLIRELAISCLSTQTCPIIMILEAREYGVPRWFSEGLGLLAINLDQYPVAEVAQDLGWETAAKIFALGHAASRVNWIPLSQVVCSWCSEGCRRNEEGQYCCPRNCQGYSDGRKSFQIRRQANTAQDNDVESLLLELFGEELNLLERFERN
ncbi:hypothetical protein BKA70DRAFT_1103695 [Coprinopsis sp. MPI-PUGE-AT-0042]|nr:hypothetical protein BKA70DRAFT_1103695 [Coprinopsis sp. MPI-PUGE-AT-0042]